MIRIFPSPAVGLRTAFRQWREEVRTSRPELADRPPHRRARGKVTLLGAGPGAADLMTLSGLRALQAADVIFFDRLCDPAL